MGTTRQITILPSQGCRRSSRVLAYLQAHNVAFTQIDLDSPEGQALAIQHDLRASPGILIDGVSLNPFESLIQPARMVDEEKACAAFVG